MILVNLLGNLRVAIIVRSFISLHLWRRCLLLTTHDNALCRAVRHLFLAGHLLELAILEVTFCILYCITLWHYIARGDLITVSLKLDFLAGWKTVARRCWIALLHTLLIWFTPPLALSLLLLVIGLLMLLLNECNLLLQRGCHMLGGLALSLSEGTIVSHSVSNNGLLSFLSGWLLLLLI